MAYEMQMFGIMETTSKKLEFVRAADLRLVTDDMYDELMQFIEDNQEFGFDIETSGLSFLVDRIAGYSVSTTTTSYYVPINHSLGGNVTFAWQKPLESLQSKKLVYHNAKFDIKFLKARYGVEMPLYADTFIMMALLDSDRIEQKQKLGLKFLGMEQLGIEMLELQEDLGTHDFTVVPVEDAVWYAGADPMVTLLLFHKFRNMFKGPLLDIFRIEMELLPFVVDMEAAGVEIDQPFLEANSPDLAQEIRDRKREIEEYGDFQYDANSPKQVSELFYDHLKIRQVGDNRSVAEKVISQLSDDHPIIDLYLNYVELNKLYFAFVDKIHESVAEDGRLHSEFHQTGTRSGRFSSSGGIGRNGVKLKINMQQMPKSKRFNIRRAFITKPRHYWVHADFSQLEYRVMASLSNETSLIEAYRRGVDFHVQTASTFLGKPLEQVTDDDRGVGKILNFAVSYGMSAFALGKMLGKTTKEAEAMLNAYFKNLPRLKALSDNIKIHTEKTGKVTTYFGRERWYRDMPEDPKARERVLRSTFNSYIQGTAADIAKKAMVQVARALKDESSPFYGKIRCVLTVHDELNFEVCDSIPPAVACKYIEEKMSVQFTEDTNVNWVEFPAEVSFGPSFGQQYEPGKKKGDDFYSKHADTLYVDLKHLFQTKEERNVEAAAGSFDIAAPSAILSTAMFSNRRVGALHEIIAKNPGEFAVYLKLDSNHVKLNDKFNINMTPKVQASLSEVGFDVHVLANANTVDFDVDSLF